jgi:hypothetical protein
VITSTFSLVLYTDLSDPNEGLFTLDFPQVDITTFSKVNVVPIPTTLMLLGSGLAGLVMLKKKFRG